MLTHKNDGSLKLLNLLHYRRMTFCNFIFFHQKEGLILFIFYPVMLFF